MRLNTSPTHVLCCYILFPTSETRYSYAHRFADDGLNNFHAYTARDMPIPYQDFLGFTRAVASATSGSSGQ